MPNTNRLLFCGHGVFIVLHSNFAVCLQLNKLKMYIMDVVSMSSSFLCGDHKEMCNLSMACENKLVSSLFDCFYRLLHSYGTRSLQVLSNDRAGERRTERETPRPPISIKVDHIDQSEARSVSTTTVI